MSEKWGRGCVTAMTRESKKSCYHYHCCYYYYYNCLSRARQTHSAPAGVSSHKHHVSLGGKRW